MDNDLVVPKVPHFHVRRELLVRVAIPVEEVDGLGSVRIVHKGNVPAVRREGVTTGIGEHEPGSGGLGKKRRMMIKFQFYFFFNFLLRPQPQRLERIPLLLP